MIERFLNVGTGSSREPVLVPNPSGAWAQQTKDKLMKGGKPGPEKASLPLRVARAIGDHAEVVSDEQQSLDVGGRLRALQGEEFGHVHVG